MSAAEFQRRLACAWVEGENEITSALRTPQENAVVGGAPNSQHLIGQAVDVVGPDLVELARSAGECGLVAVPTATHLHLQLETADQGDILEAEESSGVEPEELPERTEVRVPRRRCRECGYVNCECDVIDAIHCVGCGFDPCRCGFGPGDEEPWWLHDDPCDVDDDD